MRNETYFSSHRVLYKWVLNGKVIAVGFTSQKKAMDWLKENNMKGKGCELHAYSK